MTDLTETEQPIVRSLFRSFVDTVSDVTFGSPVIAKFIQDGLLSFSDRVLRVSPSIQVSEQIFYKILKTFLLFKIFFSLLMYCKKNNL